ncbi:leucine-rich repeat neuronal protein 3 [Condylostylus longicornis]|uniref:leucine-rich repeat neuronal protein 3 n=1 Tax=Condylostylus longicornis TaxID=2530218 RepID=UPI00244E07B6|nr:leucine-rich repeat neuronal protein 3 [Condylostylus longicornis]
MFSILKQQTSILSLILFLSYNLSYGICADNENITSTTVIPEKQQNDIPVRNLTIKVKDTDLCTKCSCYESAKVLDCSYKNLTDWFTKDELDAMINDDDDYTFETINLEGNLLKEIQEFPSLKNLKILNFHKNQIENITNGAFTKLFNLKYLSYNLLDTKTLDPDVFRGRYNPHLFEPMKNLTHLNLAGNKLHSLKPDLFIHFPRIEILNLSSNSFDHIDDLSNQAISSLGYVTEMDLSNMGLSQLPTYLFNHHKNDLKILLLNNNKFEKIPSDAIGKAINLETLYLNDNPFLQFDKENKFPILPNLKELHISNCQNLLSIGSESLSGLQSLTELFITNNSKLKTIHPNALAHFKFNSTELGYPPLKNLSLNNNNIEILPRTLLAVENWHNIEEIDLRNNSWICTCKNDFLLNTLVFQLRKRTPNLLTNVNCHQPEEFYGVPIKNFNIKNGFKINCNDDEDDTNGSNYGAITGILIGIIIVIPLAFILFIIYKRGCFGLISNPNDPAKFSRAFYSRTNNSEEFIIFTI